VDYVFPQIATIHTRHFHTRYCVPIANMFVREGVYWVENTNASNFHDEYNFENFLLINHATHRWEYTEFGAIDAMRLPWGMYMTPLDT
jgi:hypothetical protein